MAGVELVPTAGAEGFGLGSFAPKRSHLSEPVRRHGEHAWHVHARVSAEPLLWTPSHCGSKRATPFTLQPVWHRCGNPVLSHSCDRGAEAAPGRGSFSFEVTRKGGAQSPLHGKDSAPSNFSSDSPKQPTRRSLPGFRGRACSRLRLGHIHPRVPLARCPELPSLQSYGRSAYGAGRSWESSPLASPGDTA